MQPGALALMWLVCLLGLALVADAAAGPRLRLPILAAAACFVVLVGGWATGP
jgi:hypothetical protein